MDSVIAALLAEGSFDETGEDLWEAAQPHLPEALTGRDRPLLDAIEDVARTVGAGRTVDVGALFNAYLTGSDLLRAGLLASALPEAREACRHLIALEHVALTRLAAGYAAGLEETIARLEWDAEQSSAVDGTTGAIKPLELQARLTLEVDRCQRMDLPLGLLALDIGEPEQPQQQAVAADRQTVGTCLQDNLRRYDSVGLTRGGAFVLVLPDISRRGLAAAAERLRRELAGCLHGEVPMFIALAHYDFVDASPTEMLHALEEGLRQARQLRQPLAWAS